MNTYAVDIQAAAAVAPFNVAVAAPEGFDQAVRRALRKLEDSGAYRVLAVRPNPSEYDSHAYEVEVQATTGVEYKDDVFTVNVAAPEGFGQAERRAIRRAVQRAGEWNAENAGGNLRRRPESRDEYRVVSIGLTV
ncbi:hypothetical protein [Rhodococcus erythropolis]|uniref:hypothetical protein n=1 Tax=Rhodococcus erythropolis TaxID=1833 RepID=UPI00087826C6|nr:hypothetical protein [Rhodococcus erythropolis]OFV72761.1 hypothetical protein RERY_65770 [Rhodococcus erythropolis]